MVGAHNSLLTWGRRTNKFSLPRMYKLKDYQEAVDFYKQIQWPPVKIVLTGTGRVGQGAASVLMDSVFASPGTPSNNKWPPVKTPMRSLSRT